MHSEHVVPYVQKFGKQEYLTFSGPSFEGRHLKTLSYGGQCNQTSIILI